MSQNEREIRAKKQTREKNARSKIERIKEREIGIKRD